MFEFFDESEVANLECLSVFEIYSHDNETELPTPPLKRKNTAPPMLAVPLTKPKKISKKIKKDDFDYKKYIEAELKRLNAEGMDDQSKKRLVQKIRNRMSAQRSRQRNKNIMEGLKDENQMLRKNNELLQESLLKYKGENQALREQLRSLQRYKNSYSTTDNDELSFEGDDFNFVRKDKKGNSPILKNFLFISVMMVAVIVGSNNKGSNIQMGGVVPLLGNHINKPGKDLRNICREFCLENLDTKDSNGYKRGGDIFLKEDDRNLAVYQGVNSYEVDRRVCFEEGKEEERRIVLFKKGSLEEAGETNNFLYASKVLHIGKTIVSDKTTNQSLES